MAKMLPLADVLDYDFTQIKPNEITLLLAIVERAHRDIVTDIAEQHERRAAAVWFAEYRKHKNYNQDEYANTDYFSFRYISEVCGFTLKQIEYLVGLGETYLRNRK